MRPRRPAREAPLLRVLRALADPTRLRIWRRVAASRRPLCVRDLAARLPVSQPTISHHLRVLREAGLVAVTRRGTWSWFRAAPGGLGVLRDLRLRGEPAARRAPGARGR